MLLETLKKIQGRFFDRVDQISESNFTWNPEAVKYHFLDSVYFVLAELLDQYENQDKYNALRMQTAMMNQNPTGLGLYSGSKRP